jgi:hypothetical protein
MNLNPISKLEAISFWNGWYRTCRIGGVQFNATGAVAISVRVPWMQLHSLVTCAVAATG